MPAHTFKRQEKLKSKKAIASLFRCGQAVSAYPLRLVWMHAQSESGPVTVQFGLSVPKKSFPLATARNPIRRRMRESYRLRKGSFIARIGDIEYGELHIMAIYVAKESLSYQQIDKAMKKALDRIVRQANALASGG